MSVPKICGLETEYGVWVADPASLPPEQAALALVEGCSLAPRVPWDAAGETPERDARDEGRPARGGPEVGGGAERFRSRPGAAGCHAGYLLGSGGRLYADHGHPEYATPECADALALVACDLAGERLIERCRHDLNRSLPAGQSIRLIKNNSDHQGHSYGCHESYLMDAAAYRSLFRERLAELHGCLVPFLVSRIVVCGAGKVGSENGRPAVPFQISQRADFCETILGLQTMSRRPIVNTRDEAHAVSGSYRRLHIIAGDANRAQVSAWLKVGTLQLLLSMLEDGARLPDLTLADPVAAIGEISRDPSCTVTVPLRDGSRRSALEMQRAFAAAAEDYLASARPAGATGYEAILARWRAVLEKLALGPEQLAGTLDWATKWRFLEDWRRRRGLPWSAAELRELDLRYHDIARRESVFDLLAASRGIEELVGEAEIAGAEAGPPGATRAAARDALLRQEPESVLAASWSSILRRADGGGTPLRQHLESPISGGAGASPAACASAGTPLGGGAGGPR